MDSQDRGVASVGRERPHRLAAAPARGSSRGQAVSPPTGAFSTTDLIARSLTPVAGRRITTHWSFLDTVREQASDATVLDGVRYVRDGNLVTAAGVSAGIDTAL